VRDDRRYAHLAKQAAPCDLLKNKRRSAQLERSRGSETSSSGADRKKR
jgi:hypothetical protein